MDLKVLVTLLLEMTFRKETLLKYDYEKDKIKIPVRYIFGLAPVIF